MDNEFVLLAAAVASSSLSLLFFPLRTIRTLMTIVSFIGAATSGEMILFLQ
jgi:hypothetical protein